MVINLPNHSSSALCTKKTLPHKQSSWLVKCGHFMPQVSSMLLTFLRVFLTHLVDSCKWRLSVYAAFWLPHYNHKLCMTDQFFLCAFQQSKIKQIIELELHVVQLKNSLISMIVFPFFLHVSPRNHLSTDRKQDRNTEVSCLICQL